ncbi:MAG TPA: helix-turn-helix domain-containing protein [Candidatus Thermoplasmatota archaeon]|nr:helix-turn-helix domain-containing protein [Candidatus Thermoplasmatota archaeon]
MHATGPAEDLEDLKALVQAPPLGAVEESHIVEEDAHGLLFFTSWRRPRDAAEGVSLEHLLLDVVGPEAVPTMSIRDGWMEYRVVSRDGAKLLDFYQMVQQALGPRHPVRLHRVGEMRGKLTAAPAGEAPALKTEDQQLLREALVRGYYDNPKKCGLRELGDALGVSKSAIARKLRTLERRALETFATAQAPRSPFSGK